MVKRKIDNIIRFLNDDSCSDIEKFELILLIKNVFDLNEKQANKVYEIWKCKYMKARV